MRPFWGTIAPSINLPRRPTLERRLVDKRASVQYPTFASRLAIAARGLPQKRGLEENAVWVRKESEMLVEQRTYTLQANGTGLWMAHYQRIGMAVQLRILPRMLGYFTTEIGPLNQIVHLWGYDSFEQRLERRATLFADPDWLDFVTAVTPIIVSQESKLMIPTTFSPMR